MHCGYCADGDGPLAFDPDGELSCESCWRENGFDMLDFESEHFEVGE